MRLLVLPLLAAAATAAAAAPIQGPALAARDAACRTLHHANPPRAPAQVRKLGELPPGDLVLTVYRTENGCPAPLIVRKGIGGFGEAPEPGVAPRRR